MKIQGPNHSNFNPYQKQVQKQNDIKNHIEQKDQLQISSKAKELQESNKPDPARQAHVEKIKQAVDSGEYQVNPEKTAAKMIDFWSKRV